jgi:nitrogen fixation/metabolism regulation signal transduction histidine kinase
VTEPDESTSPRAAPATPPPSSERTLLRFSRFERRILGALVAVACVPLVAALLLGRAVLRDAYDVGVNERVEAQLEESLELYRAHFVALRAHAERAADAIAFHHRLVTLGRSGDDGALAAWLEQARAREDVPERPVRVARVEVRRDDRLVARAGRPIDEDEERSLDLARRIDGEAGTPSLEVRVVVTTPAAGFARYTRAGEVVEVYRRLRGGAGYLSTFYLLSYSAVLLAVIVSALAVGLVVSRRLTRRVAALADAARRVGAGDLTVEVPSDRGDEVGELVRAFNAMVRDIRSSRDRIEYLQRMAAWQEMARRLAHEIKNPLTPIQLAMQDVHERYEGDDARFRRRLRDARDIVEEEVRTLRRLVTEFSDFARLPVPALEPADLVELARECARTLEPAAMLPEGAGPERVPSLRAELPDAPVPVAVDAGLLRKAVDNLVRNATQALAQAGVERGHVVLAVARTPSGALLEVRDDGPGVPEPERARVFDAYFTTKSEGTGLGLAITKKIVLEHGGTIECAPAPEGGAAFRIHLPLHPRPSPRAQGPTSAEPSVGPSSGPEDV